MAEEPVSPPEEKGRLSASTAAEAIVEPIDGFQGVLSKFQADAEGLTAALKEDPTLPISPAILGVAEEIKAIIDPLDALVHSLGATVSASQQPADNPDRSGQR